MWIQKRVQEALSGHSANRALCGKSKDEVIVDAEISEILSNPKVKAFMNSEIQVSDQSWEITRYLAYRHAIVTCLKVLENSGVVWLVLAGGRIGAVDRIFYWFGRFLNCPVRAISGSFFLLPERPLHLNSKNILISRNRPFAVKIWEAAIYSEPPFGLTWHWQIRLWIVPKLKLKRELICKLSISKKDSRSSNWWLW